MKREDGFYWVRFNQTGADQVSELLGGVWFHAGTETNGFPDEVLERVQRDSDLVKQRDELVTELSSIAMKISGELCCFTGGEEARYTALKKAYESLERTLARIEAAKSGVTE